jgi:hypothetical protein
MSARQIIEVSQPTLEILAASCVLNRESHFLQCNPAMIVR